MRMPMAFIATHFHTSECVIDGKTDREVSTRQKDRQTQFGFLYFDRTDKKKIRNRKIDRKRQKEIQKDKKTKRRSLMKERKK